MSVTIEKLYEMIGEDLPWNEIDLGKENTRTTDLFVKYIKIWSEEKIILEALQTKHHILVKEKTQYYSGTADPEVYKEKPFNLKLKTDNVISKYVDSDTDVIQSNYKLEKQKNKVEVLKQVVDQINKRGFAIKASIDYHKFINGSF